MQRETVLALLGIVVFIVLILVTYATQIFRSPEPVTPSEQQPPRATAIAPAPSVLPSSPSVSLPISVPTNPAVAVPSVPETPPTGTERASQLAPPLASSPTVLPPAPGVGTSPPSPLPLTPAEPSLNEAVRWAKGMVEQERPRWQVRLLYAGDPRLGPEGFAVELNPSPLGEVLEVYARSPVGWLYGLLEIADRLRNGEEVPSRWRWLPPFPARGWVEPLAPFASVRWPPTRLRAALQNRLRALAWQRFNVWVLEGTGQEAGLVAFLTEAQSLASLYGVRLVLWASLTPTVRAWQRRGGIVVATAPSSSPLPNTFLAATDPAATRWLETQVVVLPLQEGHLFAPVLPPFVKTVPRRLRSRLVLVGGPEGAHEGMFWFDPEWAQGLVRAIRDEGVGGLWLRVRSVPNLWGAAAFSAALRAPDMNAERLWVKRWSRRWGTAAERWLAAFREASRIIPDILTLLGTAPQDSHPFRPQWGVPLPLFFSRRPLSSDWEGSVLSVPETLQQGGSLERASSLTATDIAQHLRQRADTVLTTLLRLPDPTDPEWQGAKRAAALNGWLGRHFAFKVEAALAWGRFEAGDQAAGRAAVLALDNAVQAWQQVVAIANALYGPANEWARRFPWWLQEARQYRARLTQAPALP